MGKYRFVFWIAFFSILLSIIPILFLNGFALIGKIFGIILIVSLSFALSIWRKQTLKQITYNQRVRLNTNDRFWLKTNVPFYKGLNAADKLVFEDRLGLILANAQILDQNGNVPERIEAISLCALAAIFLWDLPLFVFENSKWCIGNKKPTQASENELFFSMAEISEKLKGNFMLTRLDDYLNEGYRMGCITNFFKDLDERHKTSQKFLPYEEDFWNYISKNKVDFEKINIQNLN
jgi:hypothetical protein